MKKLTRYLAVSTVLLLAVFGTTLSNGSAIQSTPDSQSDPVCTNSCFLEYQACIFAVQPNRTEMNKCVAEYRHCIAHCK